MKQDNRIYLFEKASIPHAVINMAVPTVISSLVTIIYNLADTYFVGMLNNATQNAAVTLAAPVLLAFNAVNNLLGIGCSSLMSRALGAKEHDKVRDISTFGFYATVVCSMLFSILSLIFFVPLLHVLGADETNINATQNYLFWTVVCGAVPAILNVVMSYMVKSEGATFHASIGTMSGCILNIILDPIFILPWGLNMGAAGAGLATFVSNCAACIYFFILIAVKAKQKRTFISFNPRWFRFDAQIIRGIAIVGVPAAIQNLLNVTGMTVLNNLATPAGNDALAAMGIAQKINMLPMNVALGMGQGVMPLISYNFASKNYSRMKKAIYFSLIWPAVILAVIALGFYTFPATLIRMFMQKPEVVAYASSFLRGFCIELPFLCIDFITVGVFQATGMGGKAFIFAILRKIILEIPALLILNKIWPLYGLAYAQPLTEVVLAIAALIVLKMMFIRMETKPETVHNGV